MKFITAGLGENYTYDMLDRILTGATQSNTATGCWGQSFGASGAADDIYSNLTQMTVTQCTAGSLSVTVNASTNQLNTSPIFYNNAGNMTQDGAGDTFAFDAENHMTTASGTMVTGGTWSYIYDGNGLRVAKCDNESTSPCGGAAGGTLYWRDIFGNVLSESDLSGNITNDYIYFGGRKIAQEGPTGATNYFFPDQVGSTVAMTDSSGNLCYSSTFTPYGEEHSTMDTCSSTGTSTNYKFTGYERDSETGLDYAFARYYSSRLGRFMSADPLGGSTTNPQSLNRYAYVGNNPINTIDPSGLHGCVEDPGGRPYFCQQWDETGDEGAGGGSNASADGWGLSYGFSDTYVQLPDNGPLIYAGSEFILTGFYNTIGTSGNVGGSGASTLANCVSMLFHVSTISFTPSQQGMNGSFTGAMAGVFTGATTQSVPGPSMFTVTNNVTEFNIFQTTGNYELATHSSVDAGELVGGHTNTNFPFENYTAHNLQEYSTDTYAGVQLFELGNFPRYYCALYSTQPEYRFGAWKQ